MDLEAEMVKVQKFPSDAPAESRHDTHSFVRLHWRDTSSASMYDPIVMSGNKISDGRIREHPHVI